MDVLACIVIVLAVSLASQMPVAGDLGKRSQAIGQVADEGMLEHRL